LSDKSLADAYRTLAAASIAQHGGRYLARGAEAEVVEGAPTQRRIIIVEFPSLAQARAWYASPAYAEALTVRAQALDRRLIFVGGITAT
jgi:uncharacterized protein (DUF1330 family)